jgi:hypothetical protein
MQWYSSGMTVFCLLIFWVLLFLYYIFYLHWQLSKMIVFFHTLCNNISTLPHSTYTYTKSTYTPLYPTPNYNPLHSLPYPLTDPIPATSP